jgi:hypothetical protein
MQEGKRETMQDARHQSMFGARKSGNRLSQNVQWDIAVCNAKASLRETMFTRLVCLSVARNAAISRMELLWEAIYTALGICTGDGCRIWMDAID